MTMPTKSELEDRNAELASELADVKAERDSLQDELNDALEADKAQAERADEALFAIGAALQALRDRDTDLAARILEEAARAPKFGSLLECLEALKNNAPMM